MRFRRREPLHERLAREGGLVWPASREPTGFGWLESGIHGVPRPREWDLLLSVDVEGVPGHEATFLVVGDATLEAAPAAVEPLVAALRGRVEPPYRALARRHGDTQWVVGVTEVEVIELPGQEGDEIELVVRGADRELRVDGRPRIARFPALEQLVDGDAAINVRRIEGELWEVEIGRL